jgi:hypothetical protein
MRHETGQPSVGPDQGRPPRPQLQKGRREHPQHHRRIRHSNFSERTFGETPPTGQGHRQAPGETSCLTLVWAMLDRASRGWRGLTMTADGLRLLQDLRRSLLEPPRQLRPRTVTTATPADDPETVSTIA